MCSTGVGSLNQFINSGALEVLNMDPNCQVQNVLSSSPHFVQSQDDDPELLLKFSFSAPMKLNSVRILLDSTEKNRPKVIKVFQNNPAMDMGDAADLVPVGEFDLSKEKMGCQRENMKYTPAALSSLDEVECELKAAKMQAVTSIQLFVAEALAGDDVVSRLRGVEFFGSPASIADMANWKPIKG